LTGDRREHGGTLAGPEGRETLDAIDILAPGLGVTPPWPPAKKQGPRSTRRLITDLRQPGMFRPALLERFSSAAGSLNVTSSPDVHGVAWSPGEMRMTAASVSLAVACCVFGGSVVAMYASRALPDSHLGADARDVIKLGLALIATLVSLVLSLMIATAKGNYDAQSAGSGNCRPTSSCLIAAWPNTGRTPSILGTCCGARPN
jgi:hypothetical protein